ncbi:synaptobrevin homolog YKT6-like [Xenia sp. Carnegie-2017]|uniref:synaptobrevin homolog YKT6-like n=1 Tax=Xenia sp. Carnegie-2017 TaxID=2897299 RepID=UPI001F04BE83|nr:synaptobrevin homolog YKT6-like [Xenia sp. Carnegie-2017]
MVKLYALCILLKGTNVKALNSAYDLQSFGYFQRSSVKEFMDFTARIIVERTRVKERASVKEQEYVCHVYVDANNLSGVLISDSEYPSRVAFTLIGKVLEDFLQEYPLHKLLELEMKDIVFEKSREYLDKYQNPSQADPMMKVQAELDETKIVLHNTIESVLERGEKLDDLVDKSRELTIQSKTFYTTAKKTNSCCIIL